MRVIDAEQFFSTFTHTALCINLACRVHSEQALRFFGNVGNLNTAGWLAIFGSNQAAYFSFRRRLGLMQYLVDQWSR